MGVAKILGIGREIVEPIDAVGDVFDKLFTSDEERLTRYEVLERIKQNPLMWQNTLDKLNAQSSNWFVVAARPFNVWISGINMLSLNIAIVWFEKLIPEWYADVSVTAFIGSLGIYGAARTIEKFRNVN